MADVLTEIIIHSHCDKVSEYAANPDNAPKWYVNIKSVEWKTQKPLSAGSKIAFKAQFLECELSYIYQVTDYIPGKKIIMKTTQRPFPMETTYTWEPLDGNLTRMTLRNRGIPTGFSNVFAPFMSSMMKRANNKY